MWGELCMSTERVSMATARQGLSACQPPIHSPLTHTPTHPFTQPPITHPPTHPFVHLPTHPSIQEVPSQYYLQPRHRAGCGDTA